MHIARAVAIGEQRVTGSRVVVGFISDGALSIGRASAAWP